MNVPEHSDLPDPMLQASVVSNQPHSPQSLLFLWVSLVDLQDFVPWWGKKQFIHILGYIYRKGREFNKVVVQAAGQWFEGHQVGLERQPVVTASFPAFPSHCLGKTTGGTPTVSLSHGTVEQRRGRQGQASDKPKGSLARPSPPCIPDRSQWPGTHLSQIPLGGCWRAQTPKVPPLPPTPLPTETLQCC